MDMAELIARISVSERVAFVLALAERVLPSIRSNPQCRELARQAILYAWTADLRSHGTGGTLYGYLANEDEDYLLLDCEYLLPDQEKPPLFVITLAILYMARYAYIRSDDASMPELVYHATEDSLTNLLAYYAQSLPDDTQFPHQVVEYCATHHGVGEASEVGLPVSRDELLRASAQTT